VRCEELQIELTSALKAKQASRSVCSGMGSMSSGAGATIPTSASSSTVTWAPTISHQDQGSEIDIIMAKIEQVYYTISNPYKLQQTIGVKWYIIIYMKMTMFKNSNR